MATWIDGIRIIKGELMEYTQLRNESYGVSLKIFRDLHSFIEKLEENVVYGITQNLETNQYIMVIPDEFNSKRSDLNGKCISCKQCNTSPAWCQSCDPWRTTQEWTSENEIIDNFIKELQFKATGYEKVIEWISFDRLTNLQKIREDNSEITFMATWTDGIRIIKGELMEYTQSRIESYGVNFKIFRGFQTCNLFIEKLENYMQLKENVVYGITQNPETNQYIVVIPDEFNSRRSYLNGKCNSCKQYNTSPAWCQSCDPWRTTQEWTSKNENIDNFIKELQFKATGYEKVIEWIPFNNLINLQEIEESELGFVLATWDKGIREIKGESVKYIQSRTMSSVDLIELNYSILEFLENDYRIHGITQNSETGQYMLVIDFCNYKRKFVNGICEYCKRYNTNPVWCQICDPPKVDQKLSGNKNLDNCIKEFQLKATAFENIIEWIPYNRLSNIKEINRGGFGIVYSSTWLDGKRTVEGDDSLGYVRHRKKPCEVALKTLSGSQINSEFLNEVS
ncbi:hypothetical protein C2G38_695917 [Gigaspora rosea]|uniref:Protein kinase domain-containing protein n=1 Tax=Gigaspora rosea TaxID=44941 RepID=A0A397UAV0_9GLOM|nr:hypothetical protein C2G38_695917 [Gigaspora rosea]